MDQVRVGVAAVVADGEALGGAARVAEPDKAADLAWLTPAELSARHDLFPPLRRFLDGRP